MEKYELLNLLLRPVDKLMQGAMDVSKLLGAYEPTRQFTYGLIKKNMYNSFKKDHSLEVIDMDKLPDESGGIVVCNHQSWLDAQVLGSSCKRDLHFVAKSDFSDWPLLSKLIELTQSVYIKRGGDDEGLQTVVEKLKSGWLIVIFPEGTIPGEEKKSRKELEPETGLLRGHTGMVRLAIMAKVPIIPVGISGTGQAFPPEMYPRLETLPMKKKVPITIKYGDPIYFDHYNIKKISKEKLRELTNYTMKKISQLVDFSRCYVPLQVPIKSVSEISYFPKKKRKSKYGVLVLHGFTSHISCVSGLEKYLKKYEVPYKFPILRGHGTIPQDLKGVKYADWYEDAEEALREIKKHCDEVVVCGLSMGGLLAVDLGINYPDIISNVILLAPALKFADPMSALTPVLSKIFKYWDSPNSYQDQKLRDKNNKNYPYFATDSFTSLYEESKKMERRLRKFNRPVLILQSKKDKVVSPLSARIIYDKIKSKDKKICWFYKSGHEMLLDLEKENVLKKVDEYLGEIIRG